LSGWVKLKPQQPLNTRLFWVNRPARNALGLIVEITEFPNMVAM